MKEKRNLRVEREKGLKEMKSLGVGPTSLSKSYNWLLVHLIKLTSSANAERAATCTDACSPPSLIDHVLLNSHNLVPCKANDSGMFEYSKSMFSLHNN